jgi:hypothetical protein
MRSRLTLLAVSLLLLGSSRAWALTGNGLKEICARSEATFQLSCLMYVGGVSDGLNLAPVFYRDVEHEPREIICFPEELRQATRRNVVVEYLDAHDDILEYPAEVVIYMAFKEAWPCPE